MIFHPQKQLNKHVFATLVGLLAFTMFSMQEYLRGVQPFGELSAQANDQYSQFVPFAAEYRRVLLGTTDLSSFSWTWAVGGGVPMHGNFVTYDGGLLFPILLVLFPESQTELAFFFITGISYALAATFMALLLKRLNSYTPDWIVALLAVGYGLSSWALQDASYVQMWLSGLYMLPILGLVAIRTVEGRGFVSGVLAVALTWWSNYYTAYMASLGAGIFILFYILIEGIGFRTAIKKVTIFAAQGLMGVLLAAIFWLPTLRQVINGIDQPGAEMSWPKYPAFFGHFLPWIQSISFSPSFAATTFTTVLMLFAFCGYRIPNRVKVVNFLFYSGLIVSFAVPHLVLVWNFFDTPNGSLWRASFVVIFFSTVIASYGGNYLSTSRLLDWVIPVSGVVLLFAIARSNDANRLFKLPWAYFIFVILAFVVVHTLNKRHGIRLVSLVLVSGLVVMELVAGNAWMLKVRDKHFFDTHNVWTPRATAELALRSEFKKLDPSPLTRVNFGLDQKPTPDVENKGLLLSIPSPTYYSSVMPSGSLVLADQLGVTSGATPRIQRASADPVAEALLGVKYRTLNCPQEVVDANRELELEKRGKWHSYVTHPERICDNYFEIKETMLTPVPFAHLLNNDPGSVEAKFKGSYWLDKPMLNVFQTRNHVIGRAIYKQPTISTINTAEVAKEASKPGGSLSFVTEITGSCPANTKIVFDGRSFEGTISYETTASNSKHEVKYEFDIVTLPEINKEKEAFRIWIDADIDREIDGLRATDRLGCFDQDIFESWVKAQPLPMVDADRDGTLKLSFPEPQTGLMVLKMPLVEGYLCTQNGGENAEPRSLYGLIAIPVTEATHVECNYRPPLFKTGLLVSVVTAMVLLLATVFKQWKLKRRIDTTP